MCLKKRPHATVMKPLHVCKDDYQKEYTDASFFAALRKAYYKHRSWKEKALFKLKKIDFVKVVSWFICQKAQLLLTQTSLNFALGT
jgi:hypothetical protein